MGACLPGNARLGKHCNLRYHSAHLRPHSSGLWSLYFLIYNKYLQSRSFRSKRTQNVRNVYFIDCDWPQSSCGRHQYWRCAATKSTPYSSSRVLSLLAASSVAQDRKSYRLRVYAPRLSPNELGEFGWYVLRKIKKTLNFNMVRGIGCISWKSISMGDE